MKPSLPEHQFQFENPRQQYEASALGMWLFLATEILFFGGLFAGYTVYRTLYPEAFKLASLHLDVLWGAVNTIVLITSSLTMVLAVDAAKRSLRGRTVISLLATAVLGAVFMAIKAFEYSEKFRHHLVPGRHFLFPEYQGPGTQLFFSFYFVMTGIHALHLIIGIVLVLVVALMAARGKFSAQYNTPVDMTGLYWHFVDIIWVFLLPLLYLIERH